LSIENGVLQIRCYGLGPIKRKMLGLLMRFIHFIRYLEKVHQNSCRCIDIADSALVLSSTNLNCLKSGTIEIGEDTFINDMCSITAYDTAIKIGKDVFVGPGTVMHTYDHNFQRVDVPIGKQGGTTKPIIIEDDVWIGTNCTILGGVKIGAHSVIGAHSLVNKSIPPYSVAYGVPCKVKRTRLSE
jgi:acetyltransferase-like isoleucine patch superfamily enzyme